MTRAHRRSPAILVVSLALAGCPPGVVVDDGGARDASFVDDAGAVAVGDDAGHASDAGDDGGLLDGGPGDGGVGIDAGLVDGGSVDGGSVDGGAGLDGGSVDGGTVDGGAGPDGGGVDGGSADAGAPCLDCVRSALYPEDWTPAFTDGSGRFLHDFSYAGYRSGEEPPDVAAASVSVLDHGADPGATTDSSAAFQAAIDLVSGPGGGVVDVPAGDYRLDENLVVTTSGVVLRGEGPSSRLHFTRAVAMTDAASIRFSGALAYGPDLPLAVDAAPRDTVVYVDDATSLAVGDDIVVGHTITAAFIASYGMTGVWTSFTDQYKEIARRAVVAVDTTTTPHAVSLDVPLRNPMLTTWGASVRVETGHLREVGVEHLALSNAIDFDTAWTFDRAHALLFDGVKDAWVRGVTSFATTLTAGTDGHHLQSGGVKVLASKRVSVVDTTFALAQNRGGGGNGYLFEISKANEILVRDSTGHAGRHNFIQNWDFGTSGCVFLRTTSTDGRTFAGLWDPIGLTGYSEFHHSLATANLIDDSTTDDGWQGFNRGTESSGAGHSSTENVFWNTRGGGRLNSWQYGMGYVIGTEGLVVTTAIPAFDITGRSTDTAPEDYTEHLDDGDRLEPRSLYEDQRRRRLGP